MAHTQDAILYDPGGNLCMIVIPDDDKQLNDPAYNLPGLTQLRIPLITIAAQAVAGPKDITSVAIVAANVLGVAVHLPGTNVAVGNVSVGV